MKLRVEVTQEDLDEGTRLHACDCPVGRALRRALLAAGVALDGSAMPVTVAPDGTRDIPDVVVYGADGMLRAELPAGAVQLVDDFDQARALAPLTFDLEVEPW
ncbi:MAG: hypothetical protein RLO52_34565 [Sandaracinaceae bacterium]